jgi:hypothetical protein
VLTLDGLLHIGNAQVYKKGSITSPEGSWSGAVNATCATGSGKAAQSATVRQVQQ